MARCTEVDFPNLDCRDACPLQSGNQSRLAREATNNGRTVDQFIQDLGTMDMDERTGYQENLREPNNAGQCVRVREN